MRLRSMSMIRKAVTNSAGQPQPDLSVQLFNPSYNKDKFENTALTIDGRIGALQIVYAGAYLARKIDQVQMLHAEFGLAR